MCDLEVVGPLPEESGYVMPRGKKTRGVEPKLSSPSKMSSTPGFETIFVTELEGEDEGGSETRVVLCVTTVSELTLETGVTAEAGVCALGGVLGGDGGTVALI